MSLGPRILTDTIMNILSLRSFIVVLVAIGIGIWPRTRDFLGLFQQSFGSPGNEETLALYYDDIEDKESCLNRFADALKSPTIATAEAPNHVSKEAKGAFDTLHEDLQRHFPRVWKSLRVDKVHEYSLLMEWKGSDRSLDPIVFISHLDVVPATERVDAWTYPPFSGTVAQGYVWGRGSLDTKFTAVSILEAVNQLLIKGFEPKRSIIIAFGHDEEIGGHKGAKALAEKLEGVSPALVVDEGGFIVEDNLSLGKTVLARGPFAVLSTGEKTAQNWKVTVRGEGGHASLPDTGSGKTVAAKLAKVIAALETNPLPTKLEAPTTDLLKSMGEVMSFWPLRWILQHVDHPLLNPIMGQMMGSMGGKTLGALVRSTVGIVSVLAGGNADNVLPQAGSLNINVRTLPSDSRESVHQYFEMITKSIDDTIEIEDISAVVYPEQTVTPSDSSQFNMVKGVVQEIFSYRTAEKGVERKHGSMYHAIPVFPMLLTGMTDSRWYHRIAPEKIIRFSPFSFNISRGDLSMLHGVNEKVPVEEYYDAVRFFSRLMYKSAVDKDQSWSTT